MRSSAGITLTIAQRIVPTIAPTITSKLTLIPKGEINWFLGFREVAYNWNAT